MKFDMDRAMQVAAAIRVADEREAAIVGGILNCLRTKGQFDERFARHAAQAACGWGEAARREDSTFRGVSPIAQSLPSKSEIAPIVQKFYDAYRDPAAPAIA